MLIGKKVSTNTEYFGQLCNRSSKEAANYFSVFFSAYRLLTYYLVTQLSQLKIGKYTLI